MNMTPDKMSNLTLTPLLSPRNGHSYFFPFPLLFLTVILSLSWQLDNPWSARRCPPNHQKTRPPKESTRSVDWLLGHNAVDSNETVLSQAQDPHRRLRRLGEIRSSVSFLRPRAFGPAGPICTAFRDGGTLLDQIRWR